MPEPLYYAWVKLWATLRDRGAFFAIFILPVIVITTVGLATRGSSAPAVGLVVHDSGPRAAELVRGLERSGVADLRHYSTDTELKTALAESVVSVGVTVPSDYGSALDAGDRPSVAIVADASRPEAAIVQTAVDTQVVEQLGGVFASRFVAENTSASSAVAAGDAVRRADQSATHVGVVTAGSGGGAATVTGFLFTAPANLVLFMFLNALATSVGLILTRRLGISARMFTTPMSGRSVYFAEMLGNVGIALFQGLVILLVGAVLFHVNWGDPLAVGVLVVVWSVICGGASMILGTYLQSPELAISTGPIIGIVLGMLGGCMFPLDGAPAFLRVVSRIVPHGWATDAFTRVSGHGASIGAVAGDVAVLCVFAALFMLAGMRRLRTAYVNV